jgi:8-oxo-dGTP diphosphatase
MLKEFYVGVKGVICRKEQVLLLKRDLGSHYYWDLPGGRVNEGESLEETLSRELKEELPSIGAFLIKQPLGFFRISKDLEDGKGLLLLFYQVQAQPFEVTLSLEHTEYRWLNASQIEALYHHPSKSLGEGTYKAVLKALNP